jgi:hypothetical protein
MIEAKIAQEDLYLYEVIRHPTLCGEFLNNIDSTDRDEEWKYDYYQNEIICDFAYYVSICCGRSIGKTVSLTNILIWLLINRVFKGDYIVYTVPNKVHLDPVWDNLVRMFRSNSLLKQYLQRGKGINSSDHNIKLLNHMSLDCRIAGTTGSEAPVVGMHTPFEIVDEAGFYPWGTWIGLQPTLNTWQAGMRRMVSGVPTGLRENNVLYFTDKVDEKYSKHRITAHQNPRYSQENEEDNLIKYGGVDGEDYIHHVLGRHGTPTFSVFDRSLMLVKQYPVFKTKLNGLDIDDISDYYLHLSALPAIEGNVDYTMMGIDLGYTEPTAIHIMYSKNDHIYWHARIQLTKVSYPIQKQLINFIDDKFGRFDIIGVDAGGPGKPVVQDLLESEEFIHKDYPKRLIPVEFASNMVLGIDSEGEEIKTKLRPYSVSLAQEYTNSHKLVYSTTDMEFVTELERMTYTKTPTGDVVYRTLTLRGGAKGEDHHTSALLCAMVAHYTLRDQSYYKPKTQRLAGATWGG